ncbi:hypothetical protein ACIA8G_00905 [Lentzea sp. NPDC051213]|uniref:hypothetical protein n=1 Tax=Lentzea sp. NPDC051213 TaxID=3364126 RepID=UPI0037BCB122
MAFDLPPRRELPADVKERMRPAFTEAPKRRNHAPLAVAAGVVLLVAGGVAITQPSILNIGPSHHRVLTPSDRDLERCRTALHDQAWTSRRMVVFGLRKVLVGMDGRFCELTLTRASVASDGFQPVGLEGGSITYRSRRIIAGVPPFSAQTAKAKQTHGTHDNPGSFSDGVVTPDFFIVETLSESTRELIFDGRTVQIPELPEKPAVGTDSFESGDTDLWTPVNVVARCADNAYEIGWNGDHLQGWEPLQVVGLDERDGLMLAHREHQKWAICSFSETETATGAGLKGDLDISWDESDRPIILGGHKLGSGFVLAGRTSRSAKTVEVSDGGAPKVTADVEDGHFLVTLPNRGDQWAKRDQLRMVARDAENQIVYEGGFEGP